MSCELLKYTLVFLLTSTIVCPRLAADEIAVPAMEWDAVFQRTSGWTGGDAIYSVDLRDGHVLWLFADSWIGPVVDGKHGPGSRMVNNVLAIHPMPENAAAPKQDAIEFYWGPEDEKQFPTAFFRPQSDKNPKDKNWFWVADGFVQPGDRDARLNVFLWHIGQRDPENKTVWNFESRGGQLAIIDNPSDPAPQWNVSLHEVPHAIDRRRAEKDPTLRETSWGSEVVPDDSSEEGTPRVLIFGVRESDGWNKQMLLARAPAEHLEAFSAWQFRSGEEWSSDLKDATPVADAMVNEFSVHHLEVGGEPRWVLVQSEPLFGKHILVRTARHPWGPWSSPQRIYRVSGVDKSRNYFTYAAKAHPELSSAGKLLVSYVINSNDFWEAAADADIYRPRFINISLGAIEIED